MIILWREIFRIIPYCKHDGPLFHFHRIKFFFHFYAQNSFAKTGFCIECMVSSYIAFIILLRSPFNNLHVEYSLQVVVFSYA